MESPHLKNVIEAALLAAGKPLNVEQFRELFEEYERPSAADVREALGELAGELDQRAFEIVEVSSGWRAQVRSDFAGPVSRLWQERPTRYSRALLETLALIAYRQPITRAEIEDVRGVAVNPNIIRTLSERGWIRVVGHREVPGRPELLGTTREFLDYFGLASLDQLPSLAELKDMDNLGVQLELEGPSAAPETGDDGESAASNEVEAASDTDADADGNADTSADASAEAETDTDGDVPAEAANDPDARAG